MLLLLSVWIHEWVSVCVSEWVSQKMSECFTSIKQLMAYADVHLVKVKILFVFCFSLFVFRFFTFRFSLLAFRFSLFDNRSASCFYCLMSECMSEWVCALSSEWVRKWMSVLRQSNSSCHMQHSFRQSLDSFCFSLFVVCFSLFIFRFSIIGLLNDFTV